MRQPLKHLGEIFEPDPRSEARARLEAGGVRRLTLDEHRGDIDAVRLSDGVPETIRGEFETVRNLYLYSWFVYEFTVPAILYAHALMEKTIKAKCARADYRQPPPRPADYVLVVNPDADGIAIRSVIPSELNRFCSTRLRASDAPDLSIADELRTG